MKRDAVCAGRRFGRLTCIESDEEGGWLCRCDCGGEIHADAAMLQSGVIASCGCKKSRCINLKGERFGRLTVENPLPERAADHSLLWRCRCDCGRTIATSSHKLRAHRTTSCGCRRLEAARSGMTHVDGTCVESILSGTLFRNNTSGYRGVSRRNGRWQAYITYARKMVRLASYDTVEEALAARAWAEEQIRRRLENLLADDAEDEPLRLRLEAAGAGDELPLRQKIKPAVGSGGKSSRKLSGKPAGTGSQNETV